MNLLLDTHIWLWSKSDTSRLGVQVRAAIADANNELWLSSVSVWETLALMEKGRIRMGDPFEWVQRAAEQMHEAPLTHEIVRVGMGMNLPHSDPADHFLAGTAKVLRLTLVTADRNLLGVPEIQTLANR